MESNKIKFMVEINGYSGVRDEDPIAQFIREITYEYPSAKVEVVK